jgi:hypothetical protein
MLRTCLAISFAVAAIPAIAAKANAQTAHSSGQNDLLFAPSANMNVSATQSIPSFLEPTQPADRLQRIERRSPTTPKECPMPVHRPDTSRLERMRVSQPAPSVSYSMPRADLKCFNPLDQAK